MYYYVRAVVLVLLLFAASWAMRESERGKREKRGRPLLHCTCCVCGLEVLFPAGVA